MQRQINSYLAVLIITLVGSYATLILVRVANADTAAMDQNALLLSQLSRTN